MGYLNKPDLSVYGIKPITLHGGASLGPDWYKQADRLPLIEFVQAAAQRAHQKGAPVVLDIEHWPLQGPPDIVQSSLQKYMTVLTWFQNAAPGLSVGYYGAPPIRDYWRAVKGLTSPEYQAWMGENDQLRPLANAVHVLYPSLYTFYPDRAGWRTYAIAQIAEARRYAGGKPVYVFLWPQYHDSNATLRGTYLPAAYWLLELQTAKQYADGIVIWGGWQMNWDEEAEWWRITKDFMTAAPNAQPAAPLSPVVR
ncbi:MAG: hypothetical protein HZB34_09270 [Nitrospirae bacterium]|nr:hypothetical protein [Nitrospirota bacterium]